MLTIARGQGTRQNPENLYGFSPAQSRIITEERNRKQIVAAAGSGKTRTVIGLTRYRLEQGLERPGRFLILSFSRKACAEIRHRLPTPLHSAVEIRTFHSFCYRMLLELHPVLSRRSFRLLEEDTRDQFLSGILRQHADIIGGIPFHLLLKNRELFFQHFPDLAALTYRTFVTFKRGNGFLEYDDLIALLLRGLHRQKSWALEIKSRYDMILVDEFQDTDPDQLAFLSLMDPARLMVVGDDWQAIYSFRGATVQPFLNFKKIFRGTFIYPLAENYRSLQPIVRAGNHIIKKSSRQLRKTVRAVRGRGPGFPVVSHAIVPGSEPDLVQMVGACEGVHILTRSNFRRDLWIASGFSPDRVLTIHRSKGLEFPVVLLDVVGGWSGESLLTDEEIRIAYVGLSRAENLFCCLHRKRYAVHSIEGTVYSLLFEPVCRPVDRIGLKQLMEKESSFRSASAG